MLFTSCTSTLIPSQGFFKKKQQEKQNCTVDMESQITEKFDTEAFLNYCYDPYVRRRHPLGYYLMGIFYALYFLRHILRAQAPKFPAINIKILPQEK